MTDAAPEVAQAPAPTSEPVVPAAVATEPPLPAATAVPVIAVETPPPAPQAMEQAASAQPAITSETAAFAQTVPTVPDARGAAAPAADTTNAPAADVALAPAAQTDRPPAPPPPPDGMSALIEGGTSGRREVALTIDAGADTGKASEILDLLRDEGIHATFGMTGLWAQANPDLVRRMVAEGHQLINHTWDHPSLTGANTDMPPLTPEELAQELDDTEALVSDLTGGYEMRPYFRPPYGDYDATSLGYLYDDGYYFSIMWTCDTHGWAGWDAQKIVDYCTTNIKDNEIILMHTGAAAVGDFEALPGLIQFFRDNGYAFVTAEQMLQP
ncbi:MAG: polysaccharide deacetylase family protein [Thermomicrobiales bacterium]|nr:polysaccharide deacetylase family protein [Thermomicrobiales bacterium]